MQRHETASNSAAHTAADMEEHNLDDARERFVRAKAAVESACWKTSNGLETSFREIRLCESVSDVLAAQRDLTKWANSSDANYIAEIEACCTVLREALPATSGKIAESIFHLGTAYRNQGDHEKCLDCYQRVLAIQEQSPPDLDAYLEVHVVLNSIGYEFDKLGNHEKCLEYYQRALSIQEKTLPALHQDIGSSLHGIARAYGNLGNRKKCLEFFHKALALNQKSQPAMHPRIAVISTVPGQQRVLAIQTRSLTPMHAC